MKFPTEYDALDIAAPELAEKLLPASRKLKEFEKERGERRKVRKRTKAAQPGKDKEGDVQMADASAPAAASTVSSAPTTPAPSVAPGSQFITGPCTSDADCASGCCGFNTGKCAGAIVAQERDGGCGFGDAQPNDTAAQKLRQRGLKL